MNSSLLQKIRDRLARPDLEVRLEPHWGSRSPDYRSEIRKALSQETTESHHDLDFPPQSAHYSISISHCAGVGGYAIVEAPATIGFDVETYGRANPKTVLRMSSDEELSEAPSASLLWSAKEAVYKSLLSSHQPAVLSDVRLTSWQRDDEMWIYSAHCPKTQHSFEGRGLVFTTRQDLVFPGTDLVLAFFTGNR